MSYSVAFTEEVDEQLRQHLIRADGQEDLCFALWKPSEGGHRRTALIHGVVLPQPGDRRVHGNASFNPQFVERVLGEALASNSGIAFIHSHPARGWQGMSPDDVAAEQLLAPTIQGATELPLVGLTLAARDGAWSARFWVKDATRKFTRKWCETVRVVGAGLKITYCDQLLAPPQPRETQVRTVSAWGESAQANLARIRVGIIGLGSVGSIVAESLARIGLTNIKLIDFDTFKKHNLDRTLNAYEADTGRAKVQIAASAIRRSATAQSIVVSTVEYSVCEESGYRQALDCDVLFSCVDRPWPRSVLNFLAYAHLIPVIDGGIRASRTKKGALQGADWKAHVIGPGHKCLRCLGQYDPGHVALEIRGDLDDPKYIETLPEDHPVRTNENVFAFSVGLASLEIAQWLLLCLTPLDVGPVPQAYHLVTGQIDLDYSACSEDCTYPQLTSTGEREHPGIDRHAIAEVERATRQARHTERGSRSGLFQRVMGLFGRLFLN